MGGRTEGCGGGNPRGKEKKGRGGVGKREERTRGGKEGEEMRLEG